MSDFEAIDSLLDSVGPQAELPGPQRRRELREQARLSKAQVARTLGVSPSTVTGWEGGRDPLGATRTAYAYLLDGLAAKLATAAEPGTNPAAEPGTNPAAEPGTNPAAEPTAPPAGNPAPDTPTAKPTKDSDETEPAADDEVEALAAPEPCVLCGHPARTRVAGYAQHLNPSDCHPAEPPTPTPTSAPTPASAAPRTHTAQAPPREACPPHTPPPSEHPKNPAPRKRAFQEQPGPADAIHQAVQSTLAKHHGDVETATAALLKKAIPDAMQLLDETRKGARYDVIAHPWIPDILKKQTSRGADQIWEARPKWTRPTLPP
ncbi:helix-turn-helix domain-containing protein, partial [Micromonospora aurantiaca]|uniref:helix-turn-helix domain-containing protein n=2 Tax=Actinomycetes TaxID=1760 RepID=UPI0033D8C6BF